MSTVKLVGAIVDTHLITLYKADGTSISYKQGEPIVPFIVETVIPAIKQDGFYEGKLESEKTNPYKDYEKKSKVVKFFSIAKKKLADIFSSKETIAEPTQVGQTEPVETECDSGIEEVMKHAVSASDDKFEVSSVRENIETDFTTDNSIKDTDGHENTLLAMVGGKVIPDAQRLHNYVVSSNLTASSEGLDNFFRRIAKVIDKRKHSIKDLLVFLEKAELPISNDGRIIVYKALNKRNGTFVDSHTGKVKQQVGSLVETLEANVDTNRRRDCSNGLHLARRSYLRSFPCETCTVCYLDPADVVAVPSGTGDKIRVTKYHILAELTGDQYEAVKGNRPLTSVAGGKELLDKAIHNKFPEPKYHTLIKGHQGTNIEYKEFTSVSEPEPKAEPEKPTKVVTLEEATKLKDEGKTVKPETLEDQPKAQPKPKPKKRAAKKKATKGKVTKTSPRAKLLKILETKKPYELTDSDIASIKALKKQAKKGWKALGVSDEYVAVITK